MNVIIFLEEFIQSIRLPAFSSSDLYDGKSATVSGWGRTSDDETEVSDDLNFVELPVITNQECVDTYGIVFDSNICTSSPDGKSSCSVRFPRQLQNFTCG
jgi:trypsin